MKDLQSVDNKMNKKYFNLLYDITNKIKILRKKFQKINNNN